MSTPHRQDDRFVERVDAALDRCIGEADWASLCATMKSDATARARFRRRAQLHAMLRWDAVHAEVPGVEGDEAMAIVEPIEAATVVGRIVPARRHVRAWIGAASVAALIAAAVTVAMVMRSVEPGDPDPVPRGAAVGVIVDASNVRWTSEPVGVGDDIRRGAVEIAAGRLDLELRSGVALTMSGAGSMHVTSPDRVRLNAGTLRAVVPQGAEGFTVEGPRGLRVVDLGTAFTVTVDSQETAYVAVSTGRVRIEPGAGEPIDVVAGFVARVTMPDAPGGGAGLVRVTPGDRFRALAHRWSFNDGTLSDEIGAAHGQPVGGAGVVDGALRLDGVDDYVITDAAIGGLHEKTLVAWVSPATLDHRGGGVLTVQKHDTADRFDAIVFGELTPRLWMAGSDGFNRTQRPPQDGAPEDAGPNDVVMIAIAYDGDGGVRLYRQGVLYGSYRAESVMSFDGARVLMGLRHSDARPSPSVDGGAGGAGAYFGGVIDEARVYSRPLDADEIAQMHEDGPLRPAPADAEKLDQPLEGDTR